MKGSMKCLIVSGMLLFNGVLFAQPGERALRAELTAEKNAATITGTQAKDVVVTYKSSLLVGATPTISANQAQITALTANPGTSALNAELEGTGGQLVYSVELNTGAEVKVDAGNGKILFTEVKNPVGVNDEGKEAGDAPSANDESEAD
jgi:uncharacterized membrane protein YkoI